MGLFRYNNRYLRTEIKTIDSRGFWEYGFDFTFYAYFFVDNNLKTIVLEFYGENVFLEKEKERNARKNIMQIEQKLAQDTFTHKCVCTKK